MVVGLDENRLVFVQTDHHFVWYERKDGTMTLQQLRYLIAVAEKGSITEAAKSLFISQPSLSNAIREVEQSIGFRIFKRHRTGVTLTAKGMEFLAGDRATVLRFDAALHVYGQCLRRACEGSGTGTIRFCAERNPDASGHRRCMREVQRSGSALSEPNRRWPRHVAYAQSLKVRRMNPSIVRQYRSGSLPELSIWLAPGTSSFSLSRLEHAA